MAINPNHLNIDNSLQVAFLRWLIFPHLLEDQIKTNRILQGWTVPDWNPLCWANHLSTKLTIRKYCCNNAQILVLIKAPPTLQGFAKTRRSFCKHKLVLVVIC